MTPCSLLGESAAHGDAALEEREDVVAARAFLDQLLAGGEGAELASAGEAIERREGQVTKDREVAQAIEEVQARPRARSYHYDRYRCQIDNRSPGAQVCLRTRKVAARLSISPERGTARAGTRVA